MANRKSSSEFRAMSAATPTSRVELSISCRNLKDADIFSKTDPMCVLHIQQFGQNNWMEVNRTETIMNTLDPEFARKFVLTFYFEEVQRLKFEMYDVDSVSEKLSNHGYLGCAEMTLGEVVACRSVTKPLDVGSGKQFGSITVVSEELASCKEIVYFQLSARNIAKRSSSIFSSGTATPFLTFSKSNEDGSFTVVHRTEHLSSSSQEWKPFSLPVKSLCNGDFDRVIRVQCHHFKSNGNHKFIGEFSTTLSHLSQEDTVNTPFDLVNPRKEKRDSKYKNSGEILLMSLQRKQIYTFLDYIQGGTQLHCALAIDFTGSNGNPRNPSSLHYIDEYRPNQYIQALRAVGEIIQDYDSDKLFPVLGFGARLPPDRKVSHEFFVNMDANKPHCFGLDGILNAYTSCLGQIQLGNPTNFAPVINHVARIARTQRDGSMYYILLILTDGIINDMAKTKEAIASSLPMSIIIVGVGGRDFSAMEELDGDIVRLSSDGRFAERDIVQFVAFRDFERGLKRGDYIMTQAKLAKAVLSEIPLQFLSFMKKKGIKPGSPKPGQQMPRYPQQI